MTISLARKSAFSPEKISARTIEYLLSVSAQSQCVVKHQVKSVRRLDVWAEVV